jgi:hypothetical protein
MKDQKVSDRKKIRKASLWRAYKQKHSRQHMDEYERRLFYFLVDLGELYDHNDELMRDANRNMASLEPYKTDIRFTKKYRETKESQSLYTGRENYLNRLGQVVRDALTIKLIDPNPEEKSND